MVDAHHHLWDLSACQYPWLMAQGVKRFFGDPTPIQKNYLVSNLRDDAAHYQLDASVHVQVGVAPGDELKETAWLQKTGDDAGLPSAIVAYCELENPAAPDHLDAQRAYTRLRGVRQIIGRSDEEDRATGSARVLDDPVWRQHLGLLGTLGLAFDLQLTPRQLPHVAEILADCPDTKVALCHCGSPWDQSSAGIKSWREGIGLLASLPNVYCKVSGLGMFDHNWTVDSIRPIVESCIDIFGSERTMFGSNFPVDKLHASYSEVWRAYEEITSGLDTNEQRQLFAETARKFYRIDCASAFAPDSSIE
ncbi:MAG: amidohydrolase family protein [Gammaproteobacteria bacterium]|nr:amidohydrolase family protein [Gammaproteobacteria bacterium]